MYLDTIQMIMQSQNSLMKFYNTMAGVCSTQVLTQDGNFRVGELFEVEQATGTISINASFFELDGLEELRLGGVVLGGTGAVIREFSTDPTFAANSNNIVPTQKAIGKYVQPKSVLVKRDLKVNRLNAGDISFEGDRIPKPTWWTYNF